MPHSLLIDTDIGSDVEDAFALAIALCSSSLSVKGVTTVTGDTLLRAQIAKKLVKLASQPDIPVVSGYGDINDMGGWEGKQILTDQDGKLPVDHNVEKFMQEQIIDNKNKLTIICMGPLTNIFTTYFSFF